MRVLSKCKTFDVPYDSCVFFLVKSMAKETPFVIKLRTNLLSGDVSIAFYSSEEKAVKAMEMLHEQYAAFKSASVLSSGTAYTLAQLKDNGAKEKIVSDFRELFYFTFPSDEEIEVYENDRKRSVELVGRTFCR